MLNSHMTRLAQAKQVAKDISLGGGVEQAVRLGVVNGNRFPDDDPALLTSAPITRNSGGTRLQPSLAAIGGDSADIIRGKRPSLMLQLVGTVAWLATEAATALRLVLTGKPRLKLKANAALNTVVELPRDRVQFSGPLRGEGVRGPEPRPPCIPNLVFVGHLPRSHVPDPSASLATETSFISAIRFYFEGGSANLASLLNHARCVTPTTGVAKRIEDAQRQSDLFLESAA